MRTAVPAGIIGVMVLAFIEGLRRYYPARQTWARLRRARGRRSMRAMRERFEAASLRKTPVALAFILLAVVPMIYIASVAGLDDEWYEAAATVLPYAFVAVALLRTPGALARVAERMKDYEQQAGDEPDREEEPEGGDADVLAL